MLSEEDEDASLVAVDSVWYRLIPSRFPPVSIYERIIANDRIEELVQIENLTNPRLRQAKILTDGIDPIDPESPVLQNWNLAPFTYSQPGGTKFFRAIYSCLELSGDLQTALAVSLARRSAFLELTDEPPQGIAMRVLKTPVKGRFLDLRHLPATLSKDECWPIGEQVIEAGYDGILFQCPERLSASCIAVLRETALGRTQQTKHFRFQWDGKRVSSLYAFDDARKIEPELLGLSEELIAA